MCPGSVAAKQGGKTTGKRKLCSLCTRAAAGRSSVPTLRSLPPFPSSIPFHYTTTRDMYTNTDLAARSIPSRTPPLLHPFSHLTFYHDHIRIRKCDCTHPALLHHYTPINHTYIPPSLSPTRAASPFVKSTPTPPPPRPRRRSSRSPPRSGTGTAAPAP